ncbi:hypothetical protein OBBRIDRAFT_767414 [Obba rivulosa]|uniref:Uncharacterized protein n=1 Tax=Obba rivulosa TaxID=1052685 RepID=A0A8E2DTY8_9APHY|nr:hypothetical protein OBBRIDRAFT_767414 [Obba rivulosa]
MRSFTVLASALSLSIPFVAAEHFALSKRHHNSVAMSKRDDVSAPGPFNGARFTFYETGLGACGQTNTDSDFIVALNTPQYGNSYPGPNCFRQITITANGKTTTATIMDECPGCPYMGLDMSPGLFSFFADESVGVLTGTWSYNDGGSDPAPAPAPAPSPSPSPSPTPKTTPPPPPPPPTITWSPLPLLPTTTSHHTTSSPPPPPPPPPSSTWTPEPSSTSEKPSSSAPPSSSWTPSSSSIASSSSVWTPSSSAVPSSSAEPSSSATVIPTGVPGDASDPDTLLSVNQAFIGIGGLVVAGAQL